MELLFHNHCAEMLNNPEHFLFQKNASSDIESFCILIMRQNNFRL